MTTENPIGWPVGLGVAGAILLAFYLTRKPRQEGDAMTTVGRPPIPPEIASENIGEMGIAPPGYRLATNVTPEVTSFAVAMLKENYGVEKILYTPDSRSWFFRVEPHYHSPTSGMTPIGWHKGVTAYETVKDMVATRNRTTNAPRRPGAD